MSKCAYCKRKIRELPFKCKFCHGVYCSNHRLPESHRCKGLGEHKKYTKSRWFGTIEKNFSQEKSTSKKDDDSNDHEKKSHSNIKRFSRKKYHQFVYWLNEREHRRYRNWNRLIRNVVWLVIISIIIGIVWSNLAKLNDVFFVGTIAFFVLAYFWIKYFWRLLKKIKKIYGGGKNWIKYLVLIIILVLVWQGYQNKNVVFDLPLSFYSKLDFNVLFPLDYDLEDYTISGEESPTSIKTNKGIFEGLKEFFEPPDPRVVESTIILETNKFRQENGVRNLDQNSQLNGLSRSHSEDMLTRNFYSHVNPDGEDPTDRAKKAGINTEVNFGLFIQIGIAENIAVVYVGNDADCSSYSPETLGRCLVDKWKKSPGHRQNLLDSSYSDIGVGVACDNSECYATQNFR